MTYNEAILVYRLWVLCFLVVLMITQCSNQNDTIAAVRAVGNQCTTEFTIEIPDVEDIK